jgi:hypothetical protein
MSLRKYQKEQVRTEINGDLVHIFAKSFQCAISLTDGMAELMPFRLLMEWRN